MSNIKYVTNNKFNNVWNNIYLKKKIFQFIDLYVENKVVHIYDVQDLVEHKYREFIETVHYYSSEQLIKGDLPTEIKQLYLYGYGNVSNISPDVFSETKVIEKIHFPKTYKTFTTHIKDLPSSVTEVINYVFKFGNSLKGNLQQLVIPSNIKSLIINEKSNFNKSITPLLFKNTLTNLNFGDFWDNEGLPLNHGDLPNTLTTLSIMGYKQRLGPNVLPQSITSLKMTIPEYNYTIEPYVIPINVKTLVIHKYITGYDTIFSGNSIPKSVTSLEIFGSNIIFKPLNVLRLNNNENLKHLKIARGLKEGLTDSITSSMLPEKLESLSLYLNNSKLTSLPIGLISLEYRYFGSQYISMEKSYFPESLTSIKIMGAFKNRLEPGIFPPNLKQLYFNDRTQSEYSVDVIPISITDLKIGTNYPINLSKLINLKSLKFVDFFNQKIPLGHLPNSITSLVYSGEYNQPLQISNLTKLRSLEFYLRFDQPIHIGTFPNSLKSLSFSQYCNFNQSLNKVGILPPNLTSFKLGGERYNRKITVNIFPPSLKKIQLHKKMDRLISNFPNIMQSMFVSEHEELLDY